MRKVITEYTTHTYRKIKLLELRNYVVKINIRKRIDAHSWLATSTPTHGKTTIELLKKKRKEQLRRHQEGTAEVLYKASDEQL